MAYVVSARKYRPQRFEEVVGQSHVTSTIKNALLNDKLAHAFLFCGPRGVGKTTCARLLAKVINMPDPKAAIKDGSYAEEDIDISLNIFELDAASNNSVNDIHALIDQVRVPPVKGKFKVFIIDEVHMLSTNAFNAFLKTLEEPPPYALFILATTEKHKILPTILSRCQLYDFRRIQIPDIITQLEEVAKQENVPTEYDGLYIVAEKADGAMRDALSIFDRIASASEEGITLENVMANLNLLDFDFFFRAVDYMMAEDASNLLLLHDEVLQRGFESDIFINGLAGHLRNLIYCKEEPTKALLQMSDELRKRFVEQAVLVKYGTILTALNLINQCDIHYPRAKDKRLHVEIALLKICYAHRRTVGVSLEKKTPDETVCENAHAAPISKAKASPATTPKPPEIQKREPVVEAEQVFSPEKSVPEEKAGSKLESEPAVAAPSPHSTTKSASAAISSLDDLLAETASELANTDTSIKPVVLQEVQALWDEYKGSVDSPTLQSVLNNVVLSVVDNQLCAAVPTNIAKEEIQQETGLYERLRNHFNQSDLTVMVKVDRTVFPDMIEPEKKTLVSPRERYEHLKSKNPLLDNMIDALDLKLDQ